MQRPLLLALRLQAGAPVLVYHRVSPNPDPFYQPTPPAEFRRHLELLRSYFTVLPLGEVVRRLEAGRSVRRCCAITFDDGFADFRTYAYPLLQEFGVAATHFLTVHSVETGAPNWNYRLNRALHSLTLSADLTYAPRRGPAPNWAEVIRATSIVTRLPVDERSGLVERMERELSGSLPAMLRPSDLRDVDPAIVAWGSHTMSHMILVERTTDEMRRELADSRERLSSLTQTEIEFLAYPNGVADEAARTMAARSGYRASFTCEPGRLVTHTSQKQALPRIDAGIVQANAFGLELSGALPLARRMVRGKKSSFEY